jgi:hypothetical protein
MKSVFGAKQIRERVIGITRSGAIPPSEKRPFQFCYQISAQKFSTMLLSWINGARALTLLSRSTEITVSY